MNRINQAKQIDHDDPLVMANHNNIGVLFGKISDVQKERLEMQIEINKSFNELTSMVRENFTEIKNQLNHIPGLIKQSIQDQVMNCEKKEQQRLREVEEDKKKIINDPNRGVYTVETARQPTTITFDELPELFLDKVRENEKKAKEIEAWRKGNPLTKVNLTDKHSALFDLRITDVAPSQPKSDRFPHPLHDSDTGQNFSIDGDLAHCWRHLVSLNAIQYLVVKSGYLSCEDAGTGHKGSHQSYVIGDDGAIFFAWLEAKKMGVIPKDDPVPINALLYIARMHKVCDAKLIPNRNEYETKRLPMDAWNKCLLIIEEEY